MLKDVKKTSEMEKEFQANPLMMIDYAYESVATNIKLTEPMIEVFNRNIKLLEAVPAGEIMARMEKFVELDIFTTNFENLKEVSIWRVIQHYSDELIRQTKYTH